MILVRLTTTGEKSSVKRSAATLQKYFEPAAGLRGQSWDDAVAESIDRLATAGQIEPSCTGGVQVTSHGREHAEAFLGAPSLLRSRFASVQNRYFIAKSLGLERQLNQSQITKLGTAQGVCGEVLRRHHDLPLSPVPTAAAVLDSLAWSIVLRGNGDPPDNFVGRRFNRRSVLSAAFFAGHALPPGTPATLSRLAQIALSIPRGGVGAIRQRLITDWIAREIDGEGTIRNLDLTDSKSLVDLIRAVACDRPAAKFGDDKLFIAAIWDRVTDRDQAMSRTDFDANLRRAHRAGTITLCRADLVGAMDPDLVRRSRIDDDADRGGFHLVRLDDLSA